MDNVETSIVSGSFTFGLFLIYKLIKKLKVGSSCDQQGLHIHIQGLNERLQETKELLEIIVKKDEESKTNS
jgi:hypothetical protein